MHATCMDVLYEVGEEVIATLAGSSRPRLAPSKDSYIKGSVSHKRSWPTQPMLPDATQYGPFFPGTEVGHAKPACPQGSWGESRQPSAAFLAWQIKGKHPQPLSQDSGQGLCLWRALVRLVVLKSW